MDLIAYSLQDPIAASVMARLSGMMELRNPKAMGGYRIMESKDCMVAELEGPSIKADFLDSLHADRIIFVSRHSSAKGIMSFTAHATGNWSSSSDFGGRPRELSVSSPAGMLYFLREMKALVGESMPVTYEATHHGPLLDTPSLFVEVGPVEGSLDGDLAEKFAVGVSSIMGKRGKADGQVAIGIGGIHYPEKFTRLALDGKYAFSHIMSKYYTSESGMLGKAAERCDITVEKAVLDWKSIKSADRQGILSELESLGLDYDRV